MTSLESDISGSSKYVLATSDSPGLVMRHMHSYINSSYQNGKLSTKQWQKKSRAKAQCIK